jgi:hypothetical protein
MGLLPSAETIASRICQARGRFESEGTAVHETIGHLKMVIGISRECKAHNKYPNWRQCWILAVLTRPPIQEIMEFSWRACFNAGETLQPPSEVDNWLRNPHWTCKRWSKRTTFPIKLGACTVGNYLLPIEDILVRDRQSLDKEIVFTCSWVAVFLSDWGHVESRVTKCSSW